MKPEYDLAILVIAIASLLGTLWQGKSQAKQIKMLIEEREFRHEEYERKEEKALADHRMRTDILFERVANLSKQVEELKRELKDAIRDAISRIGNQ